MDWLLPFVIGDCVGVLICTLIALVIERRRTYHEFDLADAPVVQYNSGDVSTANQKLIDATVQLVQLVRETEVVDHPAEGDIVRVTAIDGSQIQGTVLYCSSRDRFLIVRSCGQDIELPYSSYTSIVRVLKTKVGDS